MPDRDRLSDSSADVVPDEASEVDAQVIEHGNDTIGMTAKIDTSGRCGIASAEAQKIENNHAMPPREQRNDIPP